MLTHVAYTLRVESTFTVVCRLSMTVKRKSNSLIIEVAVMLRIYDL